METKIKLNPGEKLKQESHRTKGPLAETDIWIYAVVDADGNTIGSVTHKDHTSIKGLHRSQSVEQRDSSGKIIVDVSW